MARTQLLPALLAVLLSVLAPVGIGARPNHMRGLRYRNYDSRYDTSRRYDAPRYDNSRRYDTPRYDNSRRYDTPRYDNSRAYDNARRYDTVRTSDNYRDSRRDQSYGQQYDGPYTNNYRGDNRESSVGWQADQQQNSYDEQPQYYDNNARVPDEERYYRSQNGRDWIDRNGDNPYHYSSMAKGGTGGTGSPGATGEHCEHTACHQHGPDESHMPVKGVDYCSKGSDFYKAYNKEAKHDQKYGSKGGHYAYAWTGCVDLKENCTDYVAVINMFPGDPECGKVVYKAHIPYGGTEAHHFGIVNDGKGMAAGGFFDFIMKTPSLFFFDLSDPAKPKYVSSGGSARGGAADDVVPLPDGGFLVTFMGSPEGATPGVVARYDSNFEHVEDLPREGDHFDMVESFNPHGIGVSKEYGVFVTVDFFQPNKAAGDVLGDIEFRQTVRLWNLEDFTLIKTFHDPKAVGFLDAKILGHKPFAVTENGAGQMYMVDFKNEEFHMVYELPHEVLPHFTIFFAPYWGGDRLFVAAWESKYLLLFNTEDPMKPTMLDMYKMEGEKATPHTVHVSDKCDQVVVVVSCYFLYRPELDLEVKLPGDKTVHFFAVVDDKIRPINDSPVLNFYEDQRGNPHHVILNYAHK